MFRCSQPLHGVTVKAMLLASTCLRRQSVWGDACITVDEALPHVRSSDHLPLWLHLSKPKLSKRKPRHHIRTWQYSQQNKLWPIAKGWKSLDQPAFNSLITTQLSQESQSTISTVSAAINQAASYTKAYPAPHEDPVVSSLYNQAALCEGSQRRPDLVKTRQPCEECVAGSNDRGRLRVCLRVYGGKHNGCSMPKPRHP